MSGGSRHGGAGPDRGLPASAVLAASAGPQTTTPPGGGVGSQQVGRYRRFSTIQSTEAITCSSVSAGLPPLAGMIPASPW
jgi:hypothetical protein